MVLFIFMRFHINIPGPGTTKLPWLTELWEFSLHGWGHGWWGRYI